MEGWGAIPLNYVAATGNLTQLYPNWITGTGSALPISPGGTLLAPKGGRIGQISIKTDGTNGGYVELWDLTGLDVPVDVSSLTTITNTNLVYLQGLNKAKLMWSQNFAASPADPAPWSLAMGFMRGLAARFVGNAGSCALNIIAEGGYDLRLVACGYAG